LEIDGFEFEILIAVDAAYFSVENLKRILGRQTILVVSCITVKAALHISNAKGLARG
jgi:hypothetical protein